MIESTIQTIDNGVYVGLANEPSVHKDFYRKGQFNNFSPRGRAYSFNGIFEGCSFNKADFKLCSLSGQFFNCTFVGAIWVGASMAGGRFVNCDFTDGNVLASDGFQLARFNLNCKNLLKSASRSLVLIKEGEYKISDLLMPPPVGSEFLPSRVGRGFGMHGPIGPRQNYDLLGDWDEDTRPGIPIRQILDRKAHLQSSDLEEYKRNCGK